MRVTNRQRPRQWQEQQCSQEETTGGHDTTNKISKMDILDNANSIDKPTATDTLVTRLELFDFALEADHILKETHSPAKGDEAPFDCEAATVAVSTVTEPLVLQRDASTVVEPLVLQF
ncbi:hypothetical protein SEMRO_126_G060570.1 [Seminavis robusta]|uniref:Uncharacterized protein n=1 Tax=Seminavis robusta TaxID=568900 RepID=A0A9N8DJX2_9STRA|nr:hypothetical protein SEMRO_126_G060570.1 [Seminavis robusta]|eukprot:Sro126_g060570.1 n/a (118) ;mRNA; f:54291-54644